MIITRTPLRISFCGGGSDLPSFYERFGGHVVSTTIDKYIYLTLERSFHTDITSLKYSKVEKVRSFDDIEHPIFRECLRMHDVKGVEINSTADIPSGTGMGSSSSFTVGVINLLRAYQGKATDKESLARRACEMEIDVLKEPIGKQDQYAAAHGGLNYYAFNKDGSVDVEPLALSEDLIETLGRRLVLFYTGGERSSSDILKKQNKSSEKRDSNQKKMCSLAIRLKDDLLSGDIDSVGELLNEGWKLKRELVDGITNSRIDDIYEIGMANGAEGGKLLGAGGAGFMLFYAHEKEQPGLKAALSGCREIPFKMESEGSKIVFNDQR
jgi:D-glycero-alpha-D-manno-heptose-7-phosphate kinase